jgi:hypothetical protein
MNPNNSQPDGPPRGAPGSYVDPRTGPPPPGQFSQPRQPLPVGLPLQIHKRATSYEPGNLKQRSWPSPNPVAALPLGMNSILTFYLALNTLLT